MLRHHVQTKRSDDIHEAVSDGFTALIRQLIKRLLLPLSADLIDNLVIQPILAVAGSSFCIDMCFTAPVFTVLSASGHTCSL